MEYTQVYENLTLTSTVSLNGHSFDNTLFQNCIIQNVTGDGLSLRDVNNVMVRNCIIKNISGDGIKLSTQGSTKNICLAHNVLLNIGGDGINAGQRIDVGVDHTLLDICGNYIDNTGTGTVGTGLRHGMYIQGSDFLIRNNIIKRSTDGNAISVRSSGVVWGNLCDTSYKAGVTYFADHVKGPSNRLIIENNSIINSGTGSSDSNINLKAIPANMRPTTVENFEIRNNNLSDNDGVPIDIEADYSGAGFTIIQANNRLVFS